MKELLLFFNIESASDFAWLIVGIFAQLMFSLRFIIQWLSSEREKRSVIPTAFWWFSLFGGITLFAYGIHRREPVIILGQSMGIIIYIRNLSMIYNEKKASGVRQV